MTEISVPPGVPASALRERIDELLDQFYEATGVVLGTDAEAGCRTWLARLVGPQEPPPEPVDDYVDAMERVAKIRRENQP